METLQSLGDEGTVVIRHVGLLMDEVIIRRITLPSESGFICESTHTIDLGQVQYVQVHNSGKSAFVDGQP